MSMYSGLFVGTHMTAQCARGGSLAFGRQCADGTLECAIHLRFVSEDSWIRGRDVQGVTLGRARGCLSGCAGPWQQPHKSHRECEVAAGAGGTACAGGAVVAVLPEELC